MLANQILPLIRTRSDLHRVGAANGHGRQLHDGVSILEEAFKSTDPKEFYTVTQKSLSSAITVMARADDSETSRRSSGRTPGTSGWPRGWRTPP